MTRLNIRYVAHVTMITGVLREVVATAAANLGQLIGELDRKHPGLGRLVLDDKKNFRLDAMVFYQPPGKLPAPLVSLDAPLEEGGTLTFW